MLTRYEPLMQHHARKSGALYATRRITFSAAHRLLNHESKCRHLHGHNYELLVHATADGELDELGRVIDFGVLKQRIGEWIDTQWDHGAIVYETDSELLAALRIISGQKIYVMNENTTAENMALHLLHDVMPRLMAGTGVQISKITLWETENCFVEVCL